MTDETKANDTTQTETTYVVQVLQVVDEGDNVWRDHEAGIKPSDDDRAPRVRVLDESSAAVFRPQAEWQVA